MLITETVRFDKDLVHIESLPSTRNVLQFNTTNCGQFEGTRSKFGILGPICIPPEEEIPLREEGSDGRFRTLPNEKR